MTGKRREPYRNGGNPTIMLKTTIAVINIFIFNILIK